MKLYLYHVAGARKGYTDIFDLRDGEAIRCGRNADCELRFNQTVDRAASNQHAEIVYDAGAFYVCDLNSAHGTFVNGRRVREQEIGTKDKVRFGTNGPQVKVYVERDLKICPVCDYPLLTRNFICYGCKRKVCSKHYDPTYEVCEACAGEARKEGVLPADYLAALHDNARPDDVSPTYLAKRRKQLRRKKKKKAPGPRFRPGPPPGQRPNKKTVVMGSEDSYLNPEDNVPDAEPVHRPPPGHRKTRVMGVGAGSPPDPQPAPPQSEPQPPKPASSSDSPPRPPGHKTAALDTDEVQRNLRDRAAPTSTPDDRPPERPPADDFQDAKTIETKPACGLCGAPYGPGTFQCQGCGRHLCSRHHYAGNWCTPCVEGAAENRMTSGPQASHSQDELDTIFGDDDDLPLLDDIDEFELP